MGRDKGLIEFQGKTFVEYVLAAMKPLVQDVIIVTGNPEYDRFDAQRIEDSVPDAGPLAGVLTGLQHSKTDRNLVVSCDIPGITTDHLKRLTELSPKEQPDVVQLARGTQTMPLVALYSKSCMQTFKGLLDSGERRLRYAVSQCKTLTLTMEDSWWGGVEDINTPDQFEGLQDHYSG